MDNFSLLKKTFSDVSLLDMAMTHRSWVNEHKDTMRSNERLEFLGDAILEFVVSEAIYGKFPDKEEGYLTALRSKIVNTVNLARVSSKLNVGFNLKLSKGEEDTGGRTNQSLLADTFEAIIGAVYLDKGLSRCREFINEYVLSDIESISAEPLKDPKSLFQEIVQSKGMPTPVYKVIKEEGPDHNKTFSVNVLVNNKMFGWGTGKSKNEAAQNAASDALKKSL